MLSNDTILCQGTHFTELIKPTQNIIVTCNSLEFLDNGPALKRRAKSDYVHT